MWSLFIIITSFHCFLCLFGPWWGWLGNLLLLTHAWFAWPWHNLSIATQVYSVSNTGKKISFFRICVQGTFFSLSGKREQNFFFSQKHKLVGENMTDQKGNTKQTKTEWDRDTKNMSFFSYWWYQYLLSTALYMLEPWERNLFRILSFI